MKRLIVTADDFGLAVPVNEAVEEAHRRGILTAASLRRLRAAGVAYNDTLFGLNDSGRMDRSRLLGFLERLPEGVTELYCHPATRQWPGPFAPRHDYTCTEEFAALTDPEVVATIRRRGIATISFARLGAHHHGSAP